MSGQANILLLSDPETFMSLVDEADPEKRLSGLKTIDDFIVCEVLRYGIFSDPSMLAPLISLYKNLFLQAPVEIRRKVYEHLPAIVSQIGGLAAGAFTPFMLLDSDEVVVATATIDYVSFGSLLNNDPMSRPKEVIDMINENIPQNPAAVIGGLLALGDPRVCRLLVPMRKDLNPAQVETVSKCYSGVSSKALVEFYLDWLEELVDLKDYTSLRIFGNVAAGFYRVAAARVVPYIVDGLRPFPFPPDGDSPLLQWNVIPLEEYANSISGRLYALEQREGAPRVLPHAMMAFGIQPASKPSDIAFMQ